MALREYYVGLHQTFAQARSGTPSDWSQLVDITELFPSAGQLGTEIISCSWCSLPVIPEARYCHNCGVPASDQGWAWTRYLDEQRVRLGHLPHGPVPLEEGDDQGAVVSPATGAPAVATAAAAAASAAAAAEAEAVASAAAEEAAEEAAARAAFWENVSGAEADADQPAVEPSAREAPDGPGSRLHLEDGTPFETVAAVNASFWSHKPRVKNLFKTPLVDGKCVSRSHPLRLRSWLETDPGFDQNGVSTGSQPTHLYATRAGFWRPGRILPCGQLAQHKVSFLFERCGDVFLVDRSRSIPFDLRYLDEPHRFGRNVWKRRKPKKKS